MFKTLFNRKTVSHGVPKPHDHDLLHVKTEPDSIFLAYWNVYHICGQDGAYEIKVINPSFAYDQANHLALRKVIQDALDTPDAVITSCNRDRGLWEVQAEVEATVSLPERIGASVVDNLCTRIKSALNAERKRVCAARDIEYRDGPRLIRVSIDSELLPSL